MREGVKRGNIAGSKSKEYFIWDTEGRLFWKKKKNEWGREVDKEHQQILYFKTEDRIWVSFPEAAEGTWQENWKLGSNWKIGNWKELAVWVCDKVE